MFGNTASNKSNIYEREWSKFKLRQFYSEPFFNRLAGLIEN